MTFLRRLGAPPRRRPREEGADGGTAVARAPPPGEEAGDGTAAARRGGKSKNGSAIASDFAASDSTMTFGGCDTTSTDDTTSGALDEGDSDDSSASGGGGLRGGAAAADRSGGRRSRGLSLIASIQELDAMLCQMSSSSLVAPHDLGGGGGGEGGPRQDGVRRRGPSQHQHASMSGSSGAAGSSSSLSVGELVLQRTPGKTGKTSKAGADPVLDGTAPSSDRSPTETQPSQALALTKPLRSLCRSGSGGLGDSSDDSDTDAASDAVQNGARSDSGYVRRRQAQAPQASTRPRRPAAAAVPRVRMEEFMVSMPLISVPASPMGSRSACSLPAARNEFVLEDDSDDHDSDDHDDETISSVSVCSGTDQVLIEFDDADIDGHDSATTAALHDSNRALATFSPGPVDLTSSSRLDSIPSDTSSSVPEESLRDSVVAARSGLGHRRSGLAPTGAPDADSCASSEPEESIADSLRHRPGRRGARGPGGCGRASGATPGDGWEPSGVSPVKEEHSSRRSMNLSSCMFDESHNSSRMDTTNLLDG